MTLFIIEERKSERNMEKEDKQIQIDREKDKIDVISLESMI